MTTTDPRIDFCIMSLQSAGIETDWDAFRSFVVTNPDTNAILAKTEDLMRESGFGPTEMGLFANSAAADIETLVTALHSGRARPAPAQTASPSAKAPVSTPVSPANVGDPMTLDEALMLLIIHNIRHGLTTYKTPIPDKYNLDNKGHVQGNVHNSTWTSIDENAFTIGQIRGISSREVVLTALAVVSDTATPDQRRTLAAWLDTNPNLPGDTHVDQWNTIGSEQYATDITHLRRRTSTPGAPDLALRTVRGSKPAATA